ncbi:MAG: ChaN family lipoprotein, partial [Burkholderiales bacterium]|nr:ChaN family lipoprotein [Burkholderiales bacterium]
MRAAGRGGSGPYARAMRLPVLFLCAALAAGPAAAAELLMFGEMHDQPDQQRQVAEAVQQLAGAGRLAAVVLEMAEVPHTTAGLPREATEPQVREALRWQGWPWDAYAAVVMNAVRAGVPVLGGNLPRASLREAMRDAAARLVNRNRLGRDVFQRGMPETVIVEKRNEFSATLYDLLTAYASQRQRQAITNVRIAKRGVWSLKDARGLL